MFSLQGDGGRMNFARRVLFNRHYIDRCVDRELGAGEAQGHH